MPQVQLSSVVQQALKERNLKADDVLRKALNIKVEGLDVGEGIVLPEGTHLFVWYKDDPYKATVKDGLIWIGDKSFASLSGAASEITGRPTTNGWSFWMVKLPGKNDFVKIADFRKRS